MNYIDLHCDALTKTEGVLQVTEENLRRGGCVLQCFAAFVNAEECPPEGRFARAASLCDQFDRMCEREGYCRVRSVADLCRGQINALLTVEEGGVTEGRLENLETLYGRGVRMMTLTWNRENEIGFPNALFREGRRTPARLRGKEFGLTAFGAAAVERMRELGMIVDVSHASDAVFADVVRLGGAPFVASHSNAAAVFPHPRNLEDGQIRALADCGGVTGLNFFSEFLSNDPTASGQREAILAHARHILDAGGEDVLAIGSDFDGIPANPFLRSAAEMPRLFDAFCKAFGARIAEKIASENALRVFRALLPSAN